MKYSQTCGLLACKISIVFALVFAGCSSLDEGRLPIVADGGTEEETASLDDVSVVVRAVRRIPADDGYEAGTWKSAVDKGSVIKMSELDSMTLEPTGTAYYSRCEGDAGEFSFDSVSLKSPYVMFELAPYYESAYWEWDGNWSFDAYDSSEGRYTVLYSVIVDVRKSKNVDVNAVTYLETSRLRSLAKLGLRFDEAKQQADRELLEALGMYGESFDFDKNTFVENEGHRIAADFMDWMLYDWMWDYSPLEITDAFGKSGLLSTVETVKDGFLGEIASWRHYNWVTDGITDFLNNFMANLYGLGACTTELEGYSLETEGDYDRYMDLTCASGKWKFSEGRFKTEGLVSYVSGTMTDERDGHVYKTVTYNVNGAPQTWMAENLSYSNDQIVPAVGYDSAEVSRAQGLSVDFQKYVESLDSTYWNTWVRYKKGEHVLNIDSSLVQYYINDCMAGYGSSLTEYDSIACLYLNSWEDGEIFSEKLNSYIDSVVAADGHYQSLCPDGWRLPEIEEWYALFDHVMELCGDRCNRLEMGKNLYVSGFGDLVYETYPVLTKNENGKNALKAVNFVNWIVAEDVYFQDFSIRCVKN